MLQTHLIAELLGMEVFDFEKVEQSARVSMSEGFNEPVLLNQLLSGDELL